MKSVVIAVAALAVLGVCSAWPQHFQTLPYRPPTHGRPPVYDLLYRPSQGRPTFHTLPYGPSPNYNNRPIRVRRQALGGSLTTNPNGGSDARLELGKAIGTPDHNVIGKVFAAGNTLGKTPVTTGGALSYNNHGFGATLAKEHTPGVKDTFSQSLNANLFKNDRHSVDANVFRSQNTLANGFKFDRNGGGIDYSHINGHGAGITHSNIPNFGSQVGLNGKANLWSSQDRNTRLDLTGHGSQWTSGPFKGQRDFGGGLGLTHFFG